MIILNIDTDTETQIVFGEPPNFWNQAQCTELESLYGRHLPSDEDCREYCK